MFIAFSEKQNDIMTKIQCLYFFSFPDIFSYSPNNNLISKVIFSKGFICDNFYIVTDIPANMHIYCSILCQQPLHQLESRIKHVKVRISPTRSEERRVGKECR